MLSKLSSSVRSEDFSRLESALSPMVHFGQEQVNVMNWSTITMKLHLSYRAGKRQPMQP